METAAKGAQGHAGAQEEEGAEGCAPLEAEPVLEFLLERVEGRVPLGHHLQASELRLSGLWPVACGRVACLSYQAVLGAGR